MFLFVCTAILVAIFLGGKLTRDIFPKPLKVWLLTKAITNWMKSRPQKFGIVTRGGEKKRIEETGVIAEENDVSIERPIQVGSPVLRDEHTIYGTDEDGRGIYVRIVRLPNNHSQADVVVNLKHEVYNVSLNGETPSAHEFALGNLKMEMAEPYRTWRIWYNGVMTCTSTKKPKNNLVHVAFNIIWKALDSPMDNRKNGNPSLLANYFGSNGLFGETLPYLLKILPEKYSQMGTLHGSVSISHPQDSAKENAEEEPCEFYLHGFRVRELASSLEASSMTGIFPVRRGENSDKEMNHDAIDTTNQTEFFGMGESGNGFRLSGFDDFWTDGRMLWASYESTLIKDVDCRPIEVSRQNSSRMVNIVDIKGSTNVEIWPDAKQISFPNGTLLKFLDLRINGENGKGVLIHSAKHLDENGTFIQHETSISRESGSAYLLKFSDPACLKVALVGGKGASLAKLQNLTDKISESDVKTARGFCITTNLFREMLDLTELSNIFNRVSRTFNKNEQNFDINDACSEVMTKVKSCGRLPEISSLLSQQMEKSFGQDWGNLRFAVRSSGVLEDGSDLSCAGQNETFLGVTKSLIAKRVLDCWASLFTAQSVKYRLNHGQPAVSEMAVVVQEMVDATAAGVIFTADPRSGNPFEMVVTANYGLGESVVSGSCDPDVITLSRQIKDKEETPVVDRINVSTLPNKCWSDVTIGNKVLGDKKSKIVMVMEESTISTKEIILDEGDSKNFCISDDVAIKLGKAAVEIESLMGQQKPVDIEWAVDSKTGKLFVLQCRNMTSLDAWTDFEIMHEFDSPIRSKLDRFTTGNTGEVLPKALYPITLTVERTIDVITQELVVLRKGETWHISPYRASTCPVFQQRLFINMFQTFYATIEKEITSATVCIDQSVFGRQVITEEMRMIAEKRYGIPSGLTKIKDLIMQIQAFRNVKALVEKTGKLYKNFKLDYSKTPQNALDFYENLTHDLIHLYKAGIAHLATSSNSSASQIFLFLFLSEGKKPSEWDSSMYEDASKLLSVFSNVESAEMPNDMNLLVNDIVKFGGDEAEITEEFLQATPTQALEWLRSNEKISQALDLFFERHGHRGVCEMDLGEPSWESDPLSFLPILRNMLKNKLSNKETKEIVKTSYVNDDELLDSLTSTLKPMTRRLIKFILPTCRNAVMYREKTKSLFVRVANQLKVKYRSLAELMVRENLLPNEGLIRHLNHFEIGQLIKKDHSTSTILQKVLKRSKIYPHLDKLQYPEICVGMPRELDNSLPVTITDTIQATPVSRGIARGTAKVCLSVEEASEILEPGDILVTHGTDIAWSPFFPILGGVVTELGGLISHGAVVAREYGLPCIVGAVNATKIFKSGDSVMLDGGKGTLSKTSE